VGGKLPVIVTANSFAGTIADMDFDDVADAYYIVVEKNKPFEQQWTAFKSACLERFIKPHIVFVTPLTESPKYVDDFLYAYGTLFSGKEGVKTYG
jgi:hypothetical protein